MRVDRLVSGPAVRVEGRLDCHRNLVGLALERGAQRTRAARKVFGKAATVDRQDVVDVALLDESGPSCRSQRLGQRACRAIFVGQWGQDQMWRLSHKVRCQFGQQRSPVSAGREQRADAKGVPVRQAVNLSAVTEQGHDGTMMAIARNSDQGEEVAAVDEALPPFQPIERRARDGRTQQCSKCRIALHFLKIVVIIDRNHTSNSHHRSPNPVSASLPIDPKPLDHLALMGEDAAPALVLRDRILSHKDLRESIARLAAWLQVQVPEPGARVASWAAKGELTCLLPLAAARAGLVHVPINPLLKRAQVGYILADSGARLLIGTPARLATLERGDLPLNCIARSESEAIIEYGLCDGITASAADPEELAAILYTSGSTGRPKGVMLSHANMWLGAESVASYLALTPQDVTLAVLPLSFDYGQNQLLSTWFAGGCVVPLDYLTPRDVIKAVGKHGVTTLAAVPPLWVQLAELDWPEETAARLQRLTNSGGALTVDLVRRLRGLFPQARLFPMYGLTEAFRSTFLDPDLVDSHPTSMGRAIPHAEILVIGDDGAVTADGEEGELVHCGPLVAHGYWQDPERTAERYRPAPAASRYGGVAVWSGDRVRREADGLLYFVGRRDAMIKSAGNRISPQEIEDVAIGTGLVAEAVALGLPDERLGQAVHLVVRARAGTSGEVEELPRKLMQELPNFMMPKQIHWRETMPISPNGKIDRTALLAELAS